MSLAYIIPGAMNDPPGSGTDLYEKFSAFRTLYAEVAEWTQTSVERLLSWELPAQREYQEIGSIRQTAIIFGLCDVLAERGANPSVIAGLSFGSVLGACVAGAIDREDIFHYLVQLRQVAEPPGPPQGLAALGTPTTVAWDEYLRQAPEGVYDAGDLGVIADGNVRLHLISGYRDALEELSRRLPPNSVGISDVPRAHHSPLNTDHQDLVEHEREIMRFHDPILPLCSCFEQKTITTAAEVRELLIENLTRKVSVPYLIAEIEKYGAEMALVIGPAQMEVWTDNVPVPFVHVEQPDHVVDALTAISELGISSSILSYLIRGSGRDG